MPYRHDVFLSYRRDPLLALQKTAEKLKETAANVQKLGEVPDAIEAVKTALDQPKATPPQTSGGAMEYGERELKRDCEGPDVAELQLRLAGFRGTLPDGEFGPGTERQVMNFQRDYMKLAQPSGRADAATLRAIDKFADDYPIDFGKLKCPCGECAGFGAGKDRGAYLAGHPKDEAHHLYEYPGMHRMLLWAVRGVFFYMPEHRFTVNSGYRCSADNAKNDRTTTNHYGKAIDIDIVLTARECNVDDKRKCEAARGRIVATADAQVGWGAPNRKALEPPDIAPTWVHYDVRCYEPKYLADALFCTSLAALDNRKPIRF